MKNKCIHNFKDEIVVNFHHELGYYFSDMLLNFYATTHIINTYKTIQHNLKCTKCGKEIVVVEEYE